MHTFIIAALSADGFLADKQDQKSTNWTSKEDFAFFVKRTKQAGVCIMGSSTYKTIGHPLKDRTTIIYTKNSQRIANSLPLPPVISHLSSNIPYTTSLPPDQLINQLSGITNEIAVCGGSSIYTLFMQAKVVNTLYLTYEPILFGQGLPLFNTPFTHKLELVNSTPLSSHTVLMEYKVPRSV